MGDKITWINHAGFELESGPIRLVCDPWLTGPAFDRGWHLLSPTRFTVEQLGNATHIWLSHEHPDHFSPADLRSVEPERRANITILFQRTRDGRVTSYCRRLGYKVRELDPLKPVELALGVTVVTDVSGIDSWLYVRTPNATYLNLNDFVIDRRDLWRRLHKIVGGSLDVLLTQFSYASWVGNRGDTTAMQQEAARKRQCIHDQIDAFRPRFVVPFASFIYFAHAENFYLNDGSNSVRSVFEEFDTDQRPCVVLYPGDIWSDGVGHESYRALHRYDEDLANRHIQYETRSVSIDTLFDAATHCAARTKASNGMWAVRLLEHLGYLKPLVAYLDDLQTFVVYRAGRPLERRSHGPADISCTADALLTCLREDFGSGTLIVNGRFQEARAGGMRRLSRAFAVNRLNSRGIRFPLGILADRTFLREHLGALMQQFAWSGKA